MRLTHSCGMVTGDYRSYKTENTTVTGALVTHSLFTMLV